MEVRGLGMGLIYGPSIGTLSWNTSSFGALVGVTTPAKWGWSERIAGLGIASFCGPTFSARHSTNQSINSNQSTFGARESTQTDMGPRFDLIDLTAALFIQKANL